MSGTRALRDGWIALALAAATVALYAPTLSFEFVRYDDPQYVTENPRVLEGLTRESVAWAFTTGYLWNYHPLTWLSHMLDVELFGVDAAGHHATNVLLHTASALALFALLLQATGARWRSAGVAAVFALHPLHVESAAWVAERKDLLSTFLGFLAIGLYVSWTRRGGAARYLASLLLFAAGLLAKSMLVTFPLLFLLLDYWPLGRLRDLRTAVRRGVEKLPFFALAAGAGALTVVVQRATIEANAAVPLSARLANAVVSYARYLGRTFAPLDLAVLYPHPSLPGGTPWAAWQVAACAGLLAAISAGVVLLRRRYLMVGWLWFVGTLVPVIGLVQVGVQALADRYTYVPLVGLAIALVWGGGEWAERRPRARGAILAAGAALLAAWTLLAALQLRHWRSSEALFARALAVTEGNFVVHNQLGVTLQRDGDLEGAAAHYREAVAIHPDYPGALRNLGQALRALGEVEEGREYLRRARLLEADTAEGQIELGKRQLAERGPGEAAVHFRRALELDPDSAAAHHLLGHAERARGDLEQAIAHYSRALELLPDASIIHQNLGDVLLLAGRRDSAIEHFRRGLELDPDSQKAAARLRAAQAGERARGDD